MRRSKWRHACALTCLGLAAGGTACAANTTAASASDTSGKFVVTLLGTGDPSPMVARFSESTLVQAGKVNLLFDAGRGVFIRLWQTGLTRGNLNAVFITHLHSDHTVGLPDLYLSGWVMDYIVRRVHHPFTIYGPGATKVTIGTHETVERIKAAYQADEYYRIHDDGLPARGLAIEGHDIGPGVVYDKHGVKVTAFPVFHGPWVKPAFGYRVDYAGRSVVLSGDTNYEPGEPLLTAARGATVVIHEVAVAGPKLRKKIPKIVAAIMRHHTKPEQAGKVFTQIKPKLAVYSHYVALVAHQGEGVLVSKPVIDRIVKATRKTYDGPLVVGQDLERIVIGAHAIKVIPPQTRPQPWVPGHVATTTVSD